MGSVIDFVSMEASRTPSRMHSREETASPMTVIQMDEVISEMGATTPKDQPFVFFSGA